MSGMASPGAPDTPVPQQWPAKVADSHHRRAYALVGLSLLSALQVLDPTLNSLALPEVAAELRMDPSVRAFASSVGTLLLAAAMLGIGILGDLRGRRRVLLVGTLGMAVGGVLCAAAPVAGVYVLGRMVMGVSTAASFGMSLAILPTVFRPEELPRVFGAWLGVQSAISVFGTIGSGALQAALGWRVTCLIIPVLAVAFVAFGALAVPDSRAAHLRKFDAIGVLLAAVALICLMGGFTLAGELGWGHPVVLGGLLLAVVLLAGFALWEARIPEPGFPIRLFAVPAFTAACVVGIAFNFANGVIAMQLPTVLESVLGRSAFVVSLALTVMSVGMLFGTLAAGEAQKRLGLSARTIFTSGLLTIAFGILLLGLVRTTTGSWYFAVCAFVVGFGIMWAQNSESAVIMSAAPKEMVGSVGAVKPALGQFGMGLGLGVVVPIILGVLRSSGATGRESIIAGFAEVMLFIAGFIALCAVGVHLLMARQRNLQSFEAPPAED
ncbi:MFS transporter [Saccharopolyspora sp. WRP15-2]|uniref:MFS transporter n=1 Tax=Saccharopolyspora oryzae TaxID=2997343 RepID=A0ABT4V390_9PSEU|nr:MFS transporter [Saccharopolyspora oryzae]MDA3628431.1 MFS transporter [Saccharopolyspora oryzae]